MSQENIDSSKVNSAFRDAIAAVLGDRPIAYHASLARSLNSVTAGVLLSQLLYWTPRSQDEDGWIWKTREQIMEETALTRTEQENARKTLVKAGVVEEKLRGVPARMHFRVKMDRLILLISERQSYHSQGGNRGGESQVEPPATGMNSGSSQLAGNLPTGWRERDQLVSGKPADKKAGNPPTFNTESTTETTSENFREDIDSNLGKSAISPKQNPGRQPRQRTPNSTSALAASPPPANISLAPSESPSSPTNLSSANEETGATVSDTGRTHSLTAVGELINRRSSATPRNAPQSLPEARRTVSKSTAVLEDPETVAPAKKAQAKPQKPRGKFLSTPYLDKVIEEFSLMDLRDSEHVPSNQHQARNLMVESGIEEEKFVQSYVYPARSQTRSSASVNNRGAYFFTCLRDLLGLREDEAGPIPPPQSRARGNGISNHSGQNPPT